MGIHFKDGKRLYRVKPDAWIAIEDSRNKIHTSIAGHDQEYYLYDELFIENGIYSFVYAHGITHHVRKEDLIES